jgi:hypothetical protein
VSRRLSTPTSSSSAPTASAQPRRCSDPSAPRSCARRIGRC